MFNKLYRFCVLHTIFTFLIIALLLGNCYSRGLPKSSYQMVGQGSNSDSDYGADYDDLLSIYTNPENSDLQEGRDQESNPRFSRWAFPVSVLNNKYIYLGLIIN